MQLFHKATRTLGEACHVEELDTESNAQALGASKAMVVSTSVDFSNLIRKLASVDRERGERGTFRTRQ